MSSVWENSERRLLLLNIIIAAVPLLYLILAAAFDRTINRAKWKMPIQQLVKHYGELGPVTRVNICAWSTWRMFSSILFTALAFIAALGSIVLLQIQYSRKDALSDNDQAYKSAGATVLAFDGLMAIAYYKSRRLSPRMGPYRLRSLITLVLFWILVLLVSIMRIGLNVHRFLNDLDALYWMTLWVSADALLGVVAIVNIAFFSVKYEQREDVMQCLEEVFLGPETSGVLEEEFDKEKKTLRLITHQKRRETPEFAAPLWRSLTFDWITPLIRLGNRRIYSEGDLFHTVADDHPSVLYARLSKLWHQRLAMSKPLQRLSLARVLTRFVMPHFVFAAMYKVVYDSFTMISPIVLNLIIKYIEDKFSANYTKRRGLIYVGLFLVIGLGQTVFLHQYFHIQYVLGVQLKSAVSTAVYDKSLKLDRSAIKASDDFSSGRVVNLMAVDAQRIGDLMAYVHTLWSAPYQITVTCILLWNQIRWGSLGGIGVLLLGLLVTKVMRDKLKSYQQALLAQKDVRVKKTSETLTGIRAVKFYAWEEAREKEIQDIRKTELQLLWKAQVINIFNRAFVVGLPALVALISFTIYTVGSGETLTPSVAFTALTLFNNLRFPLIVIPMVIASLTEATVTAERVQKFLLLPELPSRTFEPFRASKPAIEIKNLCVELHIDDEVAHQDGNDTTNPVEGPTSVIVLRNFSTTVRKGEVVCLVGRTGCGKTSLLSSILGEMRLSERNSLSDTVCSLRGKVAYCAQTAWIQTGSVRENIIFSSSYDRIKYWKIVDACALQADFDAFVDGDATEIGERGLNLSGGQKQRVALARALYRDADIYILDDIFSALDAHVTEHIFNRVVKGLLKDRAVLLCTHRFEILQGCTSIILLHDGESKTFGSVNEAMQNPIFAALAAESITSAGENASPERPGIRKQSTLRGDYQTPRMSKISSTPPHSPSFIELPGELAVETPLDDMHYVDEPPRETTSRLTTPLIAKKESSIIHDKLALIEEEKMALGKVSKEVYISYFRAFGQSWPRWPWLMVTVFLCFTVFGEASSTLSNFWLSYWSGHSLPTEESGKRQVQPSAGLGGYGMLNACLIVFTVFASYTMAKGAQQASRALHQGLLIRIIRAKLSFFESTPLGRIITRFSKDIQAVDEMIPSTFLQFAYQVAALFGVIISIAILLPYMLIAIVPLACLYLWIERLYVTVARQYRRIESVLRAPVISNFSESYEGSSTIRVSRVVGYFRLKHVDSSNANLSASYISNAANRWLAVRLETIGTTLISAVALTSVLAGRSLSAAFSGLALSQAISCVNGLNWLVRVSGEREANVVAVERIMEYDDDLQCPQELYNSTKKDEEIFRRAPGQIEFESVCLQYRPGLPYALRNVSFLVKQGEKIGVVGRTGAGKSSIIVALLRLTDLQEGVIRLHGEDTSPLSVTQIRRNIAIIPQDSTLFTGTLRRNIDPFDEADETTIWRTINRSCLGPFVRSLPQQLDHVVDEGGLNLSAGQRQLLCLARVLMKENCSILLLDEATSAVDPQTDQAIQTTIRTEFTKCTILMIAHRIKSALQYDKILVMSDGRIAEFDSPGNLLSDPTTIFAGLCRAAGEITITSTTAGADDKQLQLNSEFSPAA